MCVCVRACVCVKRNVLPCFVVIVIVNFTMFLIVFLYIFLYLYCISFVIVYTSFLLTCYLFNVFNLLLFCFYSSNLVANVITWKVRYKLTEAFRNMKLCGSLACEVKKFTSICGSKVFWNVRKRLAYIRQNSSPYQLTALWKHSAVGSFICMEAVSSD